MKNWELVVKLLWIGIFESLLWSVPSRSLKEETMDIDTLIWWVDSLSFDSSIITLDNILQDLRRVDDLIKRPGLSLSGNFLFHGCEETLWVEETSKPEGWWSFLVDPSMELVMSIEKTLNPSSKRDGQPGDLSTSWIVLEFPWHSEIEDGVDRVDNVWSHTDGTIDSIAHC